MPERRPPETGAQAAAAAPVSPLRWAALGALLIGALLPASAGVEAFPYWDLDPTRSWTPTTGIQPALTVALAAVSLLGAALALLAQAREEKHTPLVELALVTVGSLGVLAHALLAPSLHEGSSDGLEHAARSAHWLALVWTAVGIAPLARDPRLRSIILAVLAGFAVPLLAKGLLQVLVEHPATIAAFDRTKLAVFESKGWLPDSPAALAYERRLSQPDASGWFGLSNVYASFMGATAAGLGAAVVATLVRARRLALPTLVALGVALAAGVGLALSHSKGGVGAAGLALGAASLIAIAARVRPAWRPRLARLVGPGAVVAVLAAIAARGMLWTDLGERSLLFRAFYAIGSLRIWRDHPLAGVGPDGFQDAYASAKVPIATETVQSPHSVLFDWTATLGLFGLAWAVWLVWRSTRLFVDRPVEIERSDTSTDATKPDRDTLRFTAAVVAACSLGGAFIERGLATPEFAVARVLSLAGWLAAAVLLLRFMRTNAGAWFAAVSGLTLVAHAQIEVTPVWPNAAPLFGLWLGVATAGGRTRLATEAPDPAKTGRRRHGAAVALSSAVLPAAIAVWMLAAPARSLMLWQSALGDAAATVRPAAMFREAFEAAARTQDRGALQQIANDLSRVTARTVPARPETVAGAIESFALARLEPATDALADAIQERPMHPGTRTARGRVLLEIGGFHPDDSLASGSVLLAVEDAMDGQSDAGPRIALHDWAGTVPVRAAEIRMARLGLELSDERIRGLLSVAIAPALVAAERDPFAVRPAVRLMDLHTRLGDPDEARHWAEIALLLDANTMLDPIAGLTDAERARAEALVGD
jgi:hypothetical protein